MLTARSLLLAGRLDEGLSDMDQAMLRVTSGLTSPRMTAVLYCAAIGTCEGDAWELARAQEWARSLERWMASLPTLFGGALLDNCRVYRAALKRRRGQLTEAKGELEEAARNLADNANGALAGHACYELGEVHRLLGDDDAAEIAYRRARGARCRSPSGSGAAAPPRRRHGRRGHRTAPGAGRGHSARRARPSDALDGVCPRSSRVAGRGGTRPRRARWPFAQHGQLGAERRAGASAGRARSRGWKRRGCSSLDCGSRPTCGASSRRRTRRPAHAC